MKKIILLLLVCSTSFVAKSDQISTILNEGQRLFSNGKYTQAFGLYMKAAEMGSAAAQGEVGSMYFEGIGTEPDIDQAFKWVGLSAKQGDLESQFLLGLLYYQDGTGYKDLIKSYMWLDIADQNGHADGEDAVDSIAPEMGLKSILLAKALSAKCISSDYKRCG